MKSKKIARKTVRAKPKVVDVCIDLKGAVTLSEDPVVVQVQNQRIRWRLDPASAKKWRIVGLCWCGDSPPPGEFHDWLREKARLSVTDRNRTKGKWRYGILYRDKNEKRSSPPRVFDPTIRNEPPSIQQ